MTDAQSDSIVLDYVQDRPFLSNVRPEQAWYVRYLIEAAERFFGRSQIETLYKQVKEQPFSIDDFLSDAFRIAKIEHHFDARQLTKLPTSGPLVFVANHPFGVIDGLALCDLAVRARGNFRILIHAFLCQDNDLAEYFLPVDFSESKAAVKNNIRSKRVAKQALIDGIPLLVFPSGFVSTADRRGFGKVVDAPWTTFAAKMIRDAEATVVPVYFSGQNSRIFHLASQFSEALRSAALMNEVTKSFGKPLSTRIGDPLGWRELETVGNRQQLTEFLYNEVQILAKQPRYTCLSNPDTVFDT
ncbi:MAG: lysophospholipid acyltransferase family protein [Porticoccaceae bacterium]|nr:lysophospholipid acyltransferase family protein [Porticoccaceae bacterium]